MRGIRPGIRAAVAAVVTLACGLAAGAQVTYEVLYTFNGENFRDGFGTSVSVAGDVNRDGFDDLIVGAYSDDANGTGAGSASVFSGATGDILYTFNGDNTEDRFGWSVSGAGDVDGDGFDDVIVGAHFDDNNGRDSGSARVFSGATGQALCTFNGDRAGDEFGRSVSTADDVNGDGFDDLLVGAVLDDNKGEDSGSAFLYSGFDGALLARFDGLEERDTFGRSASQAGDVNGDGLPDFIIGAERGGANNGGYAVVYISIPTPGTAGVLALACLAAARRRR